MLKSKKFTLEKPKRSEGWAKFQEWNLKWNKILAIIFSILCFILLFAIFIVNIKNPDSRKKPVNISDTKNNINKTSGSEIETTVPICKLKTCNMNCENGNIQDFGDDFNNAVMVVVKPCEDINLELRNYTGKILPKNWFAKINSSFTILKFVLATGDFEVIEDEAFNTIHFSKTIRIYLAKFKVKRLTNNIFIGLNVLEELQLENFPVEEIEENVFYPLRYNLHSLSMESIPKPFSLKNVTGSVRLNVQTLSLRFNSLEDRIEADSFSGVTDLKALHLSDTRITFIHEHAFDYFSDKLKLIILTGNRLTTLSGRTFQALLNRDIKIYLANNEWICDCQLLELQEQLRKYKNRFYDVPECNTPTEFKEQPIVDSNFCGPTSSTIGDTTTEEISHSSSTTDDSTITSDTTVELSSPSTSVTMPTSTLVTDSDSTTDSPSVTTDEVEIQPNLVQIFCVNFGRTNENYNKPKEPFYLRAQSFQFKIFENSIGEVVIEINKICEDLLLIWFFNTSDHDSLNIEQGNEYGCFTNMSKCFLIPNIKKSISYVFCLMLNTETTVSPFNCASYLAFTDSVWITEEKKLLVIGILIGALLFCASLGASVVFCILKRCSLYKNQERSLPNEIIEDYTAPPIYEHPIYTQRQNNTRPAFNRSISDSSLGSARSYVSAITPSPFQVISWRMDKSRHLQKPNNFYMEKLPDRPPPLPPHPNRRSDDSNISIDPLCSISYKIEPHYNENNSYA